MKECILCNKMTDGSTGKAGIKWSMICQECKDEEDRILEDRLKATARQYIKRGWLN